MNRFTYTSNNPINRIDPTGHDDECDKYPEGDYRSCECIDDPLECAIDDDGEEEGIVLIDFEMDKKNIEMAWEILKHKDSTFGQRLLAIGWLGLVGVGTVSGGLGTLGLACVVSGPGCVAAVEGAIGLCSDGNCTNEVQTTVDIVDKVLNVTDKARTVDQFLGDAQKFLGSNYDKIASGVYQTLDGLHQVRFTDSDLLDPIMGPHGHFELLNTGGKFIKNIHQPVA